MILKECLLFTILIILTPIPDSMASLTSPLSQLNQVLPSWGRQTSAYSCDNLLAYQAFFHLPADTGNFQYRIGTMDVDSGKIVIQSWISDSAKETILIGHGYLDHSGLHSRAIRHFLAKGMNVVIYDLPGHGLSTGKRMEIGHFDNYSKVLLQLSDLIRKEIPGPLHYVGHSTSCLIATILLAKGNDPFDHMVFIAPLVRHWMWRAGMWSKWLVRAFGIKVVPQIPANLSGDKNFMSLVRNDILRSDWVPVSWAMALYAWDSQRPQGVISNRKILVLQGTFDTVVSASWNVDYLKTAFPSMEFHWIPGGRHHLLNESASLRDVVYKTIDIKLFE